MHTFHTDIFLSKIFQTLVADKLAQIKEDKFNVNFRGNILELI